MNCLNSSVFEDKAAAGAVARAGMGARDTTGVGVGVPLPSVVTAPASSSSLLGGVQTRATTSKKSGHCVGWIGSSIERL